MMVMKMNEYLLTDNDNERMMNMKNIGIVTESARGITSISIDDEFLKRRKIFFNDSVNSETCAALLKQLMFLEEDDNTSEVTIYINSPGGAVNSGLAVYDYIRLMKSPVKTVCTGICASMGSILFLAGDKREMLPHTELMMHDPSYSNSSLDGVKPNQIAELLESILKTRDTIVEIISERTGLSREEVLKITARDSYFKAEEALKIGAATAIITEL